MEAVRLDFDGKTSPRLQQGGVFDVTWTLKNPNGTPVDLTGATAELIAAPEGKSAILTMTNGNGKIVLGNTAGTVQFLLTAADTAALKVTGSQENWPVTDRVPYDFWLTMAGSRQKKTYGYLHMARKVG